ncbi:C25 family cysteine peptidase [Nostoc favosum]|uniref:C25 family cysteine peptidase n=1 Tax=Nostoc favosum CHAB5714 TaxID=2780399 RepID=A0ABS8IAU6_9NOSO|nr:C25 family cysteine peptidase [Nostoc favosum]MCC5600637.1 C25 family cysteine peptidase [Nostoc favosum CHAB5714]
MELVFTNRFKLIQKHGQQAWQSIQAAIDTYLDVLNFVAIDADIFLLDQITPEHENPNVLKQIFKRLCSEHLSKYIVFIGGDDIIPFYRLPDSTPDKVLDGDILSDSYYVDFKENEIEHWPEIAVGRFPDADTDGGQFLIKQLHQAAEMHRKGGIPFTPKCAGFSTETWRPASKRVYARLDKTVQTLSFSPPLTLKISAIPGMKVIEATNFPQQALIYINLHGHRNKPSWWGQHQIAGLSRYPEVIDHKLMQKLDLTACVILCEACHGAAIHHQATLNNSLALCALERGTLAFFGCTAKSYSYTVPEGAPSGTTGIDALFDRLIYNILANRYRFGEALRETKRFQLSQNPFDDKNILSLTLLGDPLLKFQGLGN